MDGIEATRRILHEREIPIVALTGHIGGDFVERALAAGAVSHVLKPFAAAQLVDTITDALAQRGSLDDSETTATAERRQYPQLATIESMVREGRSERDISNRLRAQYGIE